MKEVPMKATAGDQVVVEANHVMAHRREGIVVKVDDPAGAPPYRVHWTDTDTETLFFPGPDCHVIPGGHQES